MILDQTDFYARNLFNELSPEALLLVRRNFAEALRMPSIPEEVRAEMESLDRAAVQVLVGQGVDPKVPI